MRFPFACVFVIALAAAACGDGGGPPPPPGVISLSVGETRAISSSDAGTIQVSGGAGGAEFVLVALHGSQTPGATVALDFSGEQLAAAAGPPTPDLAPAASAGPTLARAAMRAAAARASFDARMRAVERQLAPRMPAARAAWAAREAARKDSRGALMSVAAADPMVGDAMTLNTHLNPCDTASNRPGHVVAVSQRAVVVADDANPAGGFTPTDYARIAQTFTDSVYPLDTRNFGVPTDIDANQGRVVIFYTRAVNEMTPSKSDFYIGGFFHPRDLFPKTSSNPNLPACATSNYAEMFYMLVPDPSGEVNGNVRTKGFVDSVTVGVLAHEFQHLINASRRLYVTNASSFEDAWLNEGLSHIAEELMFYQASGLGPRQNINLTRLLSSPTIRNAANAYQVSNFGRLIDYLEDPEASSPYGPADSLATRGAVWQLLRYAADRSTTAEQTVWQNLVNSRTAGVANMTAAFGNFLTLVRNWATAQYTDDAVSQTTATFQHPSWNYRSVIPQFVQGGTFPLKTRSLATGGTVSLTLKGGSAAYLRFGVAGNATGRITATRSGGAALPPEVSLMLVRTR
ncbi:MAG: hypothetical protein ABR499_16595 [Gemmatimonadaceae bacterium]